MGSGERDGKRASFNGAAEGNRRGAGIIVGQVLRLPKGLRYKPDADLI
jgi:hypothetical protein